MSEPHRLALLRRALTCAGADTLVDIGDDAALLRAPAGQVVVSVDTQLEGRHFQRGWLTLEQLGYRASMAALSDLAAMGVRPLGVLASLVLPDDIDDAALLELAAGQARACGQAGTAVVGGNLSGGERLSITTTVLGTPDVAAGVMLRTGAKVDDVLLLFGRAGMAAAGLAALQRDAAEPLALREGVMAWRQPQAQLAAGMKVVGHAHAAIDVSDGLSLDAARLAQASGVDAVLDGAALETTELARAAAQLGLSPLALALHGGEDYGLLVALPLVVAAQYAAEARLIGRVVAPQREAGGGRLWLSQAGALTPVAARGFDHFAGV